MNIYGFLICGEFNYGGSSYFFKEKEGLVKKNKGTVSNWYDNFKDSKFIVIPLFGSLGIQLNQVSTSTILNYNNVSDSSVVFQNRYMVDNAVLNSVDNDSSVLQISFNTVRPQATKSSVTNFLHNMGYLYINVLKIILDTQFFSKNYLQFKNLNNDNSLFITNNLNDLLNDCNVYQSALTYKNGNFKDVEKETNNPFIKKLAQNKIDFVGNNWVDETGETRTESVTGTDINQEVFIQLCNWYYQTKSKDLPIINKVTDFTNCIYLDTDFNYISNGKLIAIESKISANANNDALKNYTVTISKRINGKYLPPAEVVNNLKTSQTEKKSTVSRDNSLNEYKSLVGGGTPNPNNLNKTVSRGIL